MAFKKIEALEHNIAALPDRVTGQAQWLKEYFDANPGQLMEAFNALVEQLSDVTAADQIGYSAGDGINAHTVQSAIAALKEMIDQAATGTIPDGSLGAEKLRDGEITQEKLAQAVQEKLDGAHAHGNLTQDGAVGASSGKVIVTGEAGALTAVTMNTAHNKNFSQDAPADAGESASAGVSETVARGDHRHKSERVVYKTALDSPLQDNTRYTISSESAVTLTYPSGNFACSICITFTSSTTSNRKLSLPSTTKYIGSLPTSWDQNVQYEISIVDGVAVIAQVGDGS